MSVKRFGVSLESVMLDKLDKYVQDKRFPNRSRAISYLIESRIVEDKWNGNENVAGAIVIVYDHKKQDMAGSTTSLQHEYHCLVLSVQHIHLDHQYCLETIAVKGQAQKLIKLADKLIALKGVKHGKLVMSTT